MSTSKDPKARPPVTFKRLAKVTLLALLISPVMIVWMIFVFLEPEYVLTMYYQMKYKVFGLEHLTVQQGTRKSSTLPKTLKPKPSDYLTGTSVSLSLPPRPAEPPTELRAVVVSRRQVDLHWKDNSNNETGFGIIKLDEWDREHDEFQVEPDQTSFSDCTLVPGAHFIYQVGTLAKKDSWPNPSVEIEIPDLVRVGEILPLSSIAGSVGKCAITWTGQEFGLAWVTGRTDNERAFKVYFQRLDKSGLPLSKDLQINSASTTFYEPSLTWTGSEYAMVWLDYRNSKEGNCEHCQPSRDIFFARLSATGEKISQEVKISDQDSYYESPRLFWRINNLFLFWTNGNSIFLIKIDTNGKTIGGPTAIIDGIMSYDDADDPTSIVQSGNTFGMAWISWKDQGELYFEEYDPEKPLNKKLIRISRTCPNDNNCSANGEAPSLFWTGSTYGVCWTSMQDVNVTFIPGAEPASIYTSRVLSVFEEPCVPSNPNQTVMSSDWEGQYASPSCVWAGSLIGMAVDNHHMHLGHYEWSFITISSVGKRLVNEKYLVMSPDGNKVMSSNPNLIWNGFAYFIPGNGRLIKIEP